MPTLTLRILGCGSSGGVPRVGYGWGACDPAERKNRRRRCSLLVERRDVESEATTVLVDTSPDLREQLLDAAVARLDGILFTHSHADHTHGIDETSRDGDPHAPAHRRPCRRHDRRAAARPLRLLLHSREGSLYPPILDLHALEAACR